MMDIQQVITLALVAVAAVYLGRLGWQACKNMWSGRPGGSACAKCIMAEIAEHKRTRINRGGEGESSGRPPSAIVPIGLVRRAPTRRDE